MKDKPLAQRFQRFFQGSKLGFVVRVQPTANFLVVDTQAARQLTLVHGRICLYNGSKRFNQGNLGSKPGRNSDRDERSIFRFRNRQINAVFQSSEQGNGKSIGCHVQRLGTRFAARDRLRHIRERHDESTVRIGGQFG